jgi:hypothetical protein
MEQNHEIAPKSIEGTTKPPYNASVHEAGHAVAQILTGSYVEKVMIRTIEEINKGPYEDYSGQQFYCMGLCIGNHKYHAIVSRLFHEKIASGEFENNERTFRSSFLIRAASFIDVFESLSGPICEMIFRGRDWENIPEDGGDNDLETAKERILAFYDSALKDEKQNDAVKKSFKQNMLTVFDVFIDPVIYNVVMKVADALHEKMSLEHDEVLEIFKNWSGEKKDRKFDFIMKIFYKKEHYFEFDAIDIISPPDDAFH